jgi:hypothetical protein
MSSFRPVIRFAAARPRVTATLAAAAATASVVIAAAPGASAATVNGGAAQAGVLTASPFTTSTVMASPLTVSDLHVSHAKAGHDTAANGHANSAHASSAHASSAHAKASNGHGTATAPKAATADKAATVHKAVKTAADVQQSYTFYDSTTPSQIPAHHPIATYADGSYAVERSMVSDPGQVIWIDTDGHDANADALDVEPGDAAPSQVANWVDRRLTAHPGSIAIVYTMRSDWGAAKASVDTLPGSMRSQVRWWIADPTGQSHMVPGAQATQWYWGSGYDISTAEPGF